MDKIRYFFGGYICWFFTVVYTNRHTSWPFCTIVAYMDGCDYKEQADGSLTCKRCGRVA